ncbi:MAG: SDR family oxidoreductase [Ruminococcaceae bacterium]|nr:SDR family oxidoreductase [Oscillospiraceae bacterium]
MKVLITGGSRGIGRACVERFAKDGHRVVFLYRQNTEAAEETSRLTGALAIRANLSLPSDATAAVTAATEFLGGLDVLVNNAGISQIKLFTDVTDTDWQTMLNTNLSGSFYVTREAAKTMIANQQGRIINIGSMWGKVGASCEVPYSAAKAGLRGMTMALAKELGPSGITVNCIEPGVIATEMNATLTEDTLSSLRDETPLCRLGRPEEVAALAAFLASDEAGFITGQCIGIDGGFAV